MSLLERFRADSDFEAHGEFTLDGSNAKRKMASFQLTNDSDFLLLIAQACIAAGASALSFSIDKKSLFVSAEEVELEQDKLDNIEEFLFDEELSHTSYALLGIALNAVAERCKTEPKVTLENHTFHLTLELKGAVENLAGILSDHLKYASCEIVINNEALERIKLAGINVLEFRKDDRSILELVRHGVLIERKEVKLKPPFTAAVSRSDFRVDASFTHVIEDELYDTVLLDVYQNVLRAIAAQAKDVTDENRELLLKWLCELDSSIVPDELLEAPLFEAADRDERYSLENLQLQSAELRGLYIANKRFDLEVKYPVVFSSPSLVEKTLRSYFGTSLRDGYPLYQDAQTAHANKMRWANSPRPLELPPGTYKATDVIKGRNWQAVVGVGYRDYPSGKTLHILYQGKLLTSRELTVSVPPGSVAVLNFDEVEINDLWEHPVGKFFVSTRARVEARLMYIFRHAEPFTLDELSFNMKLYMLERLKRKDMTVRNVISGTPLFADSQLERHYSLDELSKHALVYMGHPFKPLAENFPTSILPNLVLEYDERTFKTLKQHLKDTSVIDFRRAHSRLEELDQKLMNPPDFRLPDAQYVAKESFSKGCLKAEFGITPRLGSTSKITLFKSGIPLQTKELMLTEVLVAEAVVESTELAVKSDWSGFERDTHFGAVIRSTKKKLRQMELAAIKSPLLSAEQRIALVVTYPELLREAERVPLFEGARPPIEFSIAQLREDFAEHRFLFTGKKANYPIHLKVLRPPSNDALTVLQAVFGMTLKFKDADQHLALEERKTALESATVHEEIVVGGQYHHRVPLKALEGEIGLYPKSGLSSGGRLILFVEGRLAEVRRGVLPFECDVSVQDASINLSPDFASVILPEWVEQDIISQCRTQLLEGLRSADESVRNRAFEYFLLLSKDGTPRGHYENVPFVRRSNGEFLSLKEVMDLEKNTLSYVSPDFPLQEDDGELFIHTDKEMGILLAASGFLKRRNVEKQLLAARAAREYLDSIPTDLPTGTSYESFEGLSLRAKLKRTAGESSVVGFTEAGKLLGYLDWDGLSITGQVYGLKACRRLNEELPRAVFETGGEAEFTSFVCQLYEHWFEQQASIGFPEPARRSALDILFAAPGLLTGHPTHSPSRLAQALWELPLFPLVDGTLISGAALATRLNDSLSPLVITTETRRAPEEALLIENASTEHRLLLGVFGKESLVWYEAPSRFDPDHIRQQLGRVAQWGLSPLRSLRERLQRAEEEREPTPEEKLLELLHADLTDMLGSQRARQADGYFQGTQFGTWVLGPVLYRRKGLIRFNRLNPSVKWLLHSKGCGRSHRIGRMLLLVQWVGLVNVESASFTDEHEDEFLVDLSDRMVASLSRMEGDD